MGRNVWVGVVGALEADVGRARAKGKLDLQHVVRSNDPKFS